MRSRSGRPSSAARSFARFQSVRGNHRLTFNSPFFARSMSPPPTARGALLASLFCSPRDEALDAPGAVADLAGGHLDAEGQRLLPAEPVHRDVEQLGGLLDGEQPVSVVAAAAVRLPARHP